MPDDPLVLKQLLAQLILLVRKETKRREEVERAIDALLKSLQRGKTLPDCPGQGRLFDEASDEGLTQATAGDELDAVLAGLLPGGAPEPAPRKARPHGRRRPAKDLETIDVVHDIADEIKALFAEGELQPLPDVITYQYDYRPGQVILLRHIQRKYLRRDVSSGNNNSNGEQLPAQDHSAVVTEPTPADTDQAVDGDEDTELTSQPTVEATLDTTTDTTTDTTAKRRPTRRWTPRSRRPRPAPRATRQRRRSVRVTTTSASVSCHRSSWARSAWRCPVAWRAPDCWLSSG